MMYVSSQLSDVSTHSRPKAAGLGDLMEWSNGGVSTHSRPKAAGNKSINRFKDFIVSTHSRPKAAGISTSLTNKTKGFQHTAARRRLVEFSTTINHRSHVSTHSRPKAAGAKGIKMQWKKLVSTHSRPKAAGAKFNEQLHKKQFQHTAARRRLGRSLKSLRLTRLVSTHSRPKAAGHEIGSLANLS